MFLRLIVISTLILSATNSNADEFKMSDLTVTKASATEPVLSEIKKNRGIFSTRNLAWGTMTLLGATALTGREKKVHPEHISLASLSMLSYGVFLHSYFNNEEVSGDSGRQNYKWASYANWLHIPAMLILPVAGAIAQRQYDKGKNSATGFASLHKPSALASLIGMGLATLSLTFEF